MDERVHLEEEWKNRHSEGVLLLQSRRYDDARPHLEKAVGIARRLYPRDRFPESHQTVASSIETLALLEQALGHPRQAELLFRETLESLQLLFKSDHPDIAGNLNNLAAALWKQHRLEDAEFAFQRSADMQRRLYPTATFPFGNQSFASTLNNIAHLLLFAERPAEAEPLFQEALHMRTHWLQGDQVDLADTINGLGLALMALKRSEEAESLFRQAVAMRQRLFTAPNSSLATSLNSLGLALQEQGKVLDGFPFFHEALRMRRQLYRPDNEKSRSALTQTLNNIAHGRRQQGRLDDAESLIREAMKIAPQNSVSHNNLGVVFDQRGESANALAAFEESIRLKPDNAEAHLNRSLLLLASGDFEQGWPEYEWRLRTSQLSPPPAPVWDGSPLNGRTLLLQSEQGLSDAVQFMRFASRIPRGSGGRVLLQCAPVLLDLANTCSGIDALIPTDQPIPPCDVCLPLLSVPGVMKTTLATIPAEVPYLTVDPSRVDNWKRELAKLPGLHVGIVWQGALKFKEDRTRSISLDRFRPLSDVEGISLCSLQKGHGSEQLFNGTAAGLKIHDFGSRTTASFADTAAQIQALDVVITVDTAAAHVAGALAARVWLLLPFAADWRWMREREESPWYPTMRLFRQSRRGDWDGVMKRVAAEFGKPGKLDKPRNPGDFRA